MTRPSLVLLALLALGAPGCARKLTSFAEDLDYLRRLMSEVECRDGLPPRVLVDPQCRGGICGISCLPDRWTP